MNIIESSKNIFPIFENFTSKGKITKIQNGFILPSGLYGEQWKAIKNSQAFQDFLVSDKKHFIIKF